MGVINVTIDTFKAQLYFNHHVLLGTNMVSMIIMAFFLYIFICLSSSITLRTTKGFNLNINHWEYLIHGNYSSISGILFTFKLYSPRSCYDFKIILCGVFFSFLLIIFTSNSRQYNHSRNYLLVFINFFITVCLFSSIIEVILYFTTDNNLIQLARLYIQRHIDTIELFIHQYSCICEK